MNGNRFSETVRCLRPAWWPFVWAHSFTGFLLASGKDAFDAHPSFWLQGMVAGGAWAVLLGGSAAGLTAVFNAVPADNGKNEEAPQPEVPTSLGWTATCLLLLGMAIAPVVSWAYLDVYLVGLVLAVCHAAPPLRLGRFHLGSFVLPAVGCGGLTLCSGYVAAGADPLRLQAAVLYLFGFTFLFVALRTFWWQAPSRLMPFLYAVSVLGAFLCLALAQYRTGGRWTVVALCLPPLAAWTILGLARYRRRPRGGYVPGHLIVLGTWFLTDAAVALSAMLSAP